MLGFKSYTADNVSETDEQLDYYDYLNDGYGSVDESVDTLAEHTYNPDEGDTDKVLASKSARRSMLKASLANIDTAYGKSKNTDKPATGESRIKSVNDHIEDHFKKSPEEQAKAIAGATKRLAKSYATKPENVKSKIYTKNKKLSTTEKGDVVDKAGRKIATTLGATGAPASYEHHHGDETSHVYTCSHSTRACAGKVGNRDGTCLAMGGTYRFNRNVVKQDTDSQIQHDSRETDASHPDGAGHSPYKDYHLLAVHHALEAAKSARKQGKAVAVRTNVTDESKDALNHAIHKIKTGAIHTDDETKHTAHHFMHLYNYGKNHEDTIHDPEHNVTTIASDTGSAVDSKGVLHKGNVNREQKLRSATTEQGDKHERNTYSIIGGRSTTEFDEKGKGRLFRKPKKSESKSQTEWHNKTLGNIRAVRRYDTHSTIHKAGDPENYHHPDGHGYVTHVQDGVKHKVGYQDSHVTKGASEHDARFDPRESSQTKDRHGKRVGATIVNTPTAGTSNDGAEHGNMFHNVNDIKHEHADEHGRTGVLEINHPNKMAKAGFKYERRKIELKPA